MPLFHREYGTPEMPPLVLLHGLLGSSRNWQAVARELGARFHVFAPDFPNHGASPHVEVADYSSLVAAIVDWMKEQKLGRVTLLGHSMGGKTAMLLACRHPQLVERLIVVDIAPKDYLSMSHRGEFAAMNELRLDTLRSRAEAEMLFESRVPDWAMRKFLVTNLDVGPDNHWRWLVNLPVLTAALPALERDPLTPEDRYPGATLFIAGGLSRYMEAGDWSAIESHFPGAHLEVLATSGHNPHMDAREEFVRCILQFAGQGRL